MRNIPLSTLAICSIYLLIEPFSAGHHLGAALIPSPAPTSRPTPTARPTVTPSPVPTPTPNPIQTGTRTIVAGSPPVTLYYQIPPHPIGVIFYFHGSGGSAANFVTGNTGEFGSYANAHGFAVAALDSSNRVQCQWSDLEPAAVNPDIPNVAASILFLKNLTSSITATTPIFSAGHSNGGSFAARCAEFLPQSYPALNFTAVLVSCDGGSEADQANLPTKWVLAQWDDQNQHPDFLPHATSARSLLVSHGVTNAPLTEFAPRKVTTADLLEIPGMTPAIANETLSSLTTGGILDAAGMVLANTSTSGWQNFIPKDAKPYKNDIGEKLGAAHTEHQFASYIKEEAIVFFNSTIK